MKNIEKIATLNSNSSSSILNTTKPSYYLEQINSDDTNYQKGINTSRSTNSKFSQLRQIDKSNDKTLDKINQSYIVQDTKMDTISILQNQVEKLVEELKCQISINRDILQENERLAKKYKKLKQRVINYLQNDDIDTEKIFSSYNVTIEKLMIQQKKLKEALLNSEKKEVIDVNTNDERILEEKFFQIRQENANLKKKLGIFESNQNIVWSPKINYEDKRRAPSQKIEKRSNKNMNGSNILAELMNRENLDYIQKEISSNRYDKLNSSNNNCLFFQDQQGIYSPMDRSYEMPKQINHKINSKQTPLKQKLNIDHQSNNIKSHLIQNLYSFGHKSPLTNSLNSEDKVDDIVNYNSKLNHTTPNIPFSHSIRDIQGHSKNFKHYKNEIHSNFKFDYKI